MKIIKVTIEIDSGTTLIAEGPSVQYYEIEWLADTALTNNEHGMVYKKLTGLRQYRVKLELVCHGYKPSKPSPPMIE